MIRWAMLALIVTGCVSPPVYACWVKQDREGGDMLICVPLKPAPEPKPPHVVPESRGPVG